MPQCCHECSSINTGCCHESTSLNSGCCHKSTTSLTGCCPSSAGNALRTLKVARSSTSTAAPVGCVIRRVATLHPRDLYCSLPNAAIIFKVAAVELWGEITGGIFFKCVRGAANLDREATFSEHACIHFRVRLHNGVAARLQILRSIARGPVRIAASLSWSAVVQTQWFPDRRQRCHSGLAAWPKSHHQSSQQSALTHLEDPDSANCCAGDCRCTPWSSAAGTCRELRGLAVHLLCCEVRTPATGAGAREPMPAAAAAAATNLDGAIDKAHAKADIQNVALPLRNCLCMGLHQRSCAQH